MFVKYPSIDGFHLLRRDISKRPRFDETQTVVYRPKVKLHGTNAAVGIKPDGTVFAQKRSALIDPSNDNYGFAQWVEDNAGYFSTMAVVEATTYIYGEWCGSGIQSKVALSQIGKKVFAVFTLQVGDHAFVDPAYIEDFFNFCEDDGNRPDNLYVLPWVYENVPVCFANKNSLEAAASTMNAWVDEVEAECPFVKKNFGISGTGEGLVFYPVSWLENSGLHRDHLSMLMFKAKGEKHQVNKQKKAVQIDPEEIKSMKEFAKRFVTENRLNQGLEEASDNEFKHSHIGPFIGWVSKDVKKESRAEVEANELDWKQLNKFVTARAREWYLDKLAEIT